MKVFIGWSKKQSSEIAKVLADLIRQISDLVEPWVSEEDIDAGANWNDDIREQLTQCRIGIFCITQENSESPWIHFEAGGIAKAYANKNKVVPYILGISKAELKGPLTQFQCAEANSEGTDFLIKMLADQIPEQKRVALYARYETCKDGFLEKLRLIQDTKTEAKRTRSTGDMVSEILVAVRAIHTKYKSSNKSDTFLAIINQELSQEGSPGIKIAKLRSLFGIQLPSESHSTLFPEELKAGSSNSATDEEPGEEQTEKWDIPDSDIPFDA